VTQLRDGGANGENTEARRAGQEENDRPELDAAGALERWMKESRVKTGIKTERRRVCSRGRGRGLPGGPSVFQDVAPLCVSGRRRRWQRSESWRAPCRSPAASSIVRAARGGLVPQSPTCDRDIILPKRNDVHYYISILGKHSYLLLLWSRHPEKSSVLHVFVLLQCHCVHDEMQI
jgi:hypothetical protein